MLSALGMTIMLLDNYQVRSIRARMGMRVDHIMSKNTLHGLHVIATMSRFIILKLTNAREESCIDGRVQCLLLGLVVGALLHC